MTPPIPPDSRIGLHRLLPDAVAPALVYLAGGHYRVGPARLGDVAALDAALERLAPDPMAAIPARDEDPDPATRKRRLRAARRAAAMGFPRWGSAAAVPLMGEPAALAAWVLALLARHNPDVGPGEAADLAGRMDAADWARLDRAAFPPDPYERIGRLAEREAGTADEDEGSGPPEWEEIVCDLLQTYPGLTFAAIADLTLAQLSALRRRGQPAAAVRPGGEAARKAGDALRRRWDTYFDDDERDPETGRPRPEAIAPPA